jgi:hypothetical protein
LITAALYDQREIAAYLIKAGAKINVQNNDGSTALHVAAFFCKPEILKILLKAGADKQIKNKYGDTPLKIVSAPFSEVKGIYTQMKQMLEPIGVTPFGYYSSVTRVCCADRAEAAEAIRETRAATRQVLPISDL